jgi:hypothetical protein
MPAKQPSPPLTDVYGQRAYHRDVELPGDPFWIRKELAQQRRERLERETGQDQDDGGDDP